MAEFDQILLKYTDPAKGLLHGASFVAVSKSGKNIRETIGRE
jgi:hypothetical protein